VRRDFTLSEEEKECLDATGYQWETVIDAGSKWVILRGFAIPAGYNHSVADVALRVPPSYPDVQIDMAYFFPALALTTDRIIRQTQCFLHLEGKSYQQWSRHRTALNPWRPGLDSICTHLLQVITWLQREVGRN
jgi:Prokaryotic E2 family E